MLLFNLILQSFLLGLQVFLATTNPFIWFLVPIHFVLVTLAFNWYADR